ncbi:MAG TPA: hypothetical protein VH370_02525 [Humisphaera sp.]|jgi:hypothetical protein|nr:hypothetical protein [Humisphaera sp.]
MSKSAGIPMMITHDMERRLHDAGFDQSQIDKMTPEQAHLHLASPGPQEENGDEANAKGRARSGGRSPNYPYITLEKAIERARQIYNPDRRHDVPVAVVYQKRWNYTPKNSQGDQTLAALRAYGLVEVNGTGEKRSVRISDRGYRILAGANDAVERIKDAALAPAIHAELWQMYGSSGFPSDDVIRNYLLFDRAAGRFNDKTVDGFIERFKATISFAKLQPADKMDELFQDEQDDPDDEEKDDAMDVGVRQDQEKVKIPPPPPGQKDFPLYLSNNKRAVLYIPSSMTVKDYELLKKQIENHLMVIEATSVADDQKPN